MNQVEDKKVTRCPNGHWYSAATYDSCPFCNGGAARPAEQTQPQGTAFGGNVASQETTTLPLNNPIRQQQPGGQFADVYSESGSTAPLRGTEANYAQNRPAPQTMPEDKNVTVGIWAKKAGGNEPVVGWLVAVEGKHKGEDFRLKVGKNFIGRNTNMDVCLAKDNTVSRSKHSVIIFEPKSKSFIIQAGEARELSYLNEEIVLEPKKLSIYDKITVGETTLMFVPLCGEQFSW